jgi:anti-sigma regulatory factor (Ser/Thr protein kinase)
MVAWSWREAASPFDHRPALRQVRLPAKSKSDLRFGDRISGIPQYVGLIGRDAKKAKTVSAGFYLSNDDRAPGEARRAVRTTFAQWRLPSVVNDAVVAVSELVTNAVRHGLPPVHLLLRLRPGQVRMEVDDARPELLVAQVAPDLLAESGRGLAIVDELADDSGSQRIPGDGKSVYASWNIVESTEEADSVDADADN